MWVAVTTTFIHYLHSTRTDRQYTLLTNEYTRAAWINQSECEEEATNMTTPLATTMLSLPFPSLPFLSLPQSQPTRPNRHINSGFTHALLIMRTQLGNILVVRCGKWAGKFIFTIFLLPFGACLSGCGSRWWCISAAIRQTSWMVFPRVREMDHECKQNLGHYYLDSVSVIIHMELRKLRREKKSIIQLTFSTFTTSLSLPFFRNCLKRDTDKTKTRYKHHCGAE